MKLNCKQGDLAIIVKSVMGNEGKIVRCVAYVGPVKYVPDVKGWPRGRRYPDDSVWRIDRPIAFGNREHGTRTEVMYCSDSCLRPLRGDLNDDEIETTKELTSDEPVSV